MNSEEKLVHGLKLVVEAFAEIVAEKVNQNSKTNSTTVSVPPEKHMMKVAEAAKYAGISQYAMRMLIKQGKIAHVVVGDRIFLISQAAIDDYIKQSEANSIKKEENNIYGLKKL